MKISAFLVATFFALTLVACGKPTAPESAAEGRNELPPAN